MSEPPPAGQPYGQGASGPPPGQPPHGQQPPYGQPPPYGSPQYGHTPYGHTPYGRPPHDPQAVGQGRMSLSEEKGWALGAHLSAIVAQFLGPLLIFLIQGPKSPFVRAHAAEALNFNLSVTIYFVASLILTVVLVGFVTLLGVLVMWFVCTIIATVKAGNGEGYRYPLTIRFIK